MAEKQQRTRGEYRFPYHKLDNSIAVARTIEEQGAGRLRRADLARNLNCSANSSSFEMRLVSARLFALIRRGGDFYESTAVAKRILGGTDRDRSQALLEAFRSVPLFEVALNRFDGTPLPADDAGLVTVLEGELGVKAGRGDKARQLLIASAQEAGLIHAKEGKRWLVSSVVQETQGTVVTPEGDAPVVPQPGGDPTPQPPVDPPPSSGLGWPSIDPKDLAEWEPEKLKIYMAGLEKIARALRGEPSAAKESNEVE